VQDVREAYLDLEKIYTDKTIESIKNEISNSIKRFHYYFVSAEIRFKGNNQ
jgi:hypothetical protein